MKRIPRPFIAWLLMFSLLLNGMMPLVARATQTQFSPMVICSSSPEKPHAPAKTALSHLQCTYCCSGTDNPPLPQGATGAPAYTEISFHSPLASASPLVASVTPGIAQPRAPPASA